MLHFFLPSLSHNLHSLLRFVHPKTQEGVGHQEFGLWTLTSSRSPTQRCMHHPPSDQYHLRISSTRGNQTFWWHSFPWAPSSISSHYKWVWPAFAPLEGLQNVWLGYPENMVLKLHSIIIIIMYEHMVNARRISIHAWNVGWNKSLKI